jgi:F0F1-type ATP synthase assembly protein I
VGTTVVFGRLSGFHAGLLTDLPAEISVSGASNDDRPPMANAMRWVHQITSIAIEMALPPLVGLWLDERWRTGPWLVAVGAILGFTAAMVHLLALARQNGRRETGRSRRGGTSGQGGDAKRGGN